MNMKLTRQSLLTASSLVIGGIIGASALVALADSTWVSAPSTGPAARDTNNVAAPINVGSLQQIKEGILGAIGLVTNSLTVTSGASTTKGALLVNVNGDGEAKWGSAFGSSFILKRSATYTGDAVAWCPVDHPNVVFCGPVDDQAPDAPNGFASLATPVGYVGNNTTQLCSTDGSCNQQPQQGGLTPPPTLRGNLGSDQQYTELVKKTVSGTPVFGCLLYDAGHSHKDYKIDLECSI